jgi:hypothetical protein
MSEPQVHKLVLARNPRFLLLMGLLIAIFSVSLLLYYLLSSLLWLGIAIFSIAVFSYIMINKQPLFSQQITIYDDRLEFKRSRFETSTIQFRSVTCAGPFKADPGNEKWSFNDAIYLYEEESDLYLLVKSGFSKFDFLVESIEKRCIKYHRKWEPIKRGGKNSLIEGIRKIISYDA